ncbi:DUF987 family protein [Escherichia coli]|nr:DUF987 family protein [Escherichia coli]
MKIITRGEAMRIHQQHPTSRLFPFCTGKYRWHGSAEAYTGREVQDTLSSCGYVYLAVYPTPEMKN